MKETITLNMANRGLITLPKALRIKYNLSQGDSLSVLDLDGAILLLPFRSEIDSIADKITFTLKESGESLENMLHSLREERNSYGKKD
ncbi:MAG: AbrB/MazE/SpoVT family DNA-binding domain-containing protein [Thermodesulfobacteriota bacterium]